MAVAVPTADAIRAFAFQSYVQIAQAHGDYSITLRAGTVRDDMVAAGYGPAQLPAVCAALGANLFEQQYGLRRIHVAGPLNGANTYLTYLILANVTLAD